MLEYMIGVVAIVGIAFGMFLRYKKISIKPSTIFNCIFWGVSLIVQSIILVYMYILTHFCESVTGWHYQLATGYILLGVSIWQFSKYIKEYNILTKKKIE